MPAERSAGFEARQDFYRRIDTGHVAPLWEVLHAGHAG